MSDWDALRRHTQARIGLGRAGAAQTTSELLAFQLAHAQARDAVWRPWDVPAYSRALHGAQIEHVTATTCAADRTTYLKRPDLGRQLEASSIALLTAARTDPPADVGLILSDGLSATAVQAHGLATLRAILEALNRTGIRHAPVVLVGYARVAVSDDVGEALGTRSAVIVLGERPGLSAADSLGIYLTYGPRRGNTDAQRNCISNVRTPDGLSPTFAAERLAALLGRALLLRVSGVGLKDETPRLR